MFFFDFCLFFELLLEECHDFSLHFSYFFFEASKFPLNRFQLSTQPIQALVDGVLAFSERVKLLRDHFANRDLHIFFFLFDFLCSVDEHPILRSKLLLV